MNISNKKFLKIKYIIMKSMYKKNIIYHNSEFELDLNHNSTTDIDEN